MDNWDEIRIAYAVAKLGTVSAAADALNVHRATVIRNINALEKALRAKVFIRHANGYSMTEAGKDLLTVAAITDEQFQNLFQRIKGVHSVIEGDLRITLLQPFTYLLFPAIERFQSSYPQVKVRVIETVNRLKLHYGEAHIAIRTGKRPESDDNFVSLFKRCSFGMFASPDYIKKHGKTIDLEAENLTHSFVCRDDEPQTSFERWAEKHIPNKNMTLCFGKVGTGQEAINAGLGIGFLPKDLVDKRYPSLIEVYPPNPEWTVDNWIVTHKDVHHTEKVQAFLKVLDLNSE
ncbi:MAG: LysR family transcriptional regulator [Pseudomonadota bacterium]